MIWWGSWRPKTLNELPEITKLLDDTLRAAPETVSSLIQCFLVLCCAWLPSRVWLFSTPWTVARQATASLFMGILQARILERVAMPSSSGSSQPRDWTQISHIAGSFFTVRATTEAQEYWREQPVPSPGHLLTQESSQALLHCRQILSQLSYQGSNAFLASGISFSRISLFVSVCVCVYFLLKYRWFIMC